MAKKTRVGIIFGGRSAEHEVSLQSAKNVYDAIDKTKYDVVLLGIDKEGRWHHSDASNYLQHASNPKLIALNKSSDTLTIVPGNDRAQLMRTVQNPANVGIDVVFPIVHGTYGEDGTLQGLLKLMDLPFVGAGVLASAVCMDKDVLKRLLRDAGIPTAKFVTIHLHQRDGFSYEKVTSQLGSLFFVKPANAGSSVGVHKVKSAQDFQKAMSDAFQYDHKVLCDEFIEGREIECSVLGNEDPIASVPGEVIPTHEFYSYEAKYIDEQGATLEIPAKLDAKTTKRVQALAIASFKALACEGMARVDFFLRKDGELFVNELNTIPGFTKISMYPKMWEASGVSYRELIDRLLQLALARHEREKKIKTTFET